jgi:hypothetical protein
VQVAEPDAALFQSLEDVGRRGFEWPLSIHGAYSYRRSVQRNGVMQAGDAFRMNGLGSKERKHMRSYLRRATLHLCCLKTGFGLAWVRPPLLPGQLTSTVHHITRKVFRPVLRLFSRATRVPDRACDPRTLNPPAGLADKHSTIFPNRSHTLTFGEAISRQDLYATAFIHWRPNNLILPKRHLWTGRWGVHVFTLR